MVPEPQPQPQPQQQSPPQSQYITYGQMNLINDFRTLWRDLVIWMRSYMVSAITGFSNLPAIVNRLYRIPQTLNDKLIPFFGEVNSEEAAHLMLMYIVSAQALINAQIGKDQAAADQAARDLYRYGEELAAAFARLSPFWSKEMWQYLLSSLTNMGIQEAMALLNQEYELELDIRDRILRHALILGDYTASGVINYLAP